VCSSETSFDFQRTTRRVIPEGSALHNYRYENLSSYIFGKLKGSDGCVLRITALVDFASPLGF
jgi:hypothetical protein